MAPKPANTEEAAAIAAAIARFEAEFAAVPAAEAPAYGAWQRAALIEGVSAKEQVRDPQGGERWQS